MPSVYDEFDIAAELAADDIDLENPVNVESSLNFGLLGWWISLPQFQGRFQDLLGIGPGTFFGGASATKNPVRPGSFSSIFLDGAAGYAAALQNNRFNLHAAPFSIAAWIRDDTAAGVLGTFHSAVSWYDGTNSMQIGLAQDLAGTKREFFLENGSGIIPNAFTDTVPLGWNHCLATFDGTTYAIYLNGVASVGGTPATGLGFTGNATTLYFGQRGDAAGFLAGNLDDVRIYNRCLLPAEAAAVVDDSRTGYNSTLNRIQQIAAYKPLPPIVALGVLFQNEFDDQYTSPADLIDLENPINVEHPLNTSLLAEFAVIPCLASARLRNLAAPIHAAVGSASQSRQSHPGGYGSIDLTNGAVTSALDGGRIGNSYTISTWVRISNPSGDSVDRVIVVIGTYKLYYRNAGSPRFRWEHTTGSFESFDSSYQPNLEQWYHVAITVRGTASGDARMYVNGIFSAATSGTFGAIAAGSTAFGSSAGVNVNEVMVWGRALSAAEILAVYEETLATNPTRWNRVPRIAAYTPQPAVSFPGLPLADLDDPYTTPADLIDLENPINIESSLNTGLIFWGLNLPQLRGSRLLDITNLNAAGKHGKIIGAIPRTSSVGRRGGFGATLFTGDSASWIDINSVSAGGTKWSLAMWAQVLPGGSNPMLFETIGATGRMIASLTGGNWGGNGYAISFFGGAVSYNLGAANSFPGTGQWGHLVMTFDGVTARGYVNGVLTGSDSSYAPASLDTATSIGSRNNQGGNNFSGRIDDTRLWKRVLTPAEIAEIYNDSCTGYLQTLNRIPIPALGRITVPPVPLPTGVWLDFGESEEFDDPSANDLDLEFPSNIESPLHAPWSRRYITLPMFQSTVFPSIVSVNNRNQYGTLVNNPQWSKFTYQGGLGSLKFSSAASQSVSLGSPLELATGGRDFYICAWICPTSVSTFQAIVSRQDSLTLDYVFGFGSTAGKLVTFSPNADVAESNAVLVANQWQHVAALRIGSTVFFFVNGQPQGSGTFTGTDNGLFAVPTYIGRRGSNNPNEQYFDGYIDDVFMQFGNVSIKQVSHFDDSHTGSRSTLNRISRNVARKGPVKSLPGVLLADLDDQYTTPADLIDLEFPVNAESPASAALVSLWLALPQLSGQRLFDVVNLNSRGNHGDFASGATRTCSDRPSGTAILLDGVSNVTLGSPRSLDVSITGQFTVTAWIKPTTWINGASSYLIVYGCGAFRFSLGLSANTGTMQSWRNNSTSLDGTKAVPVGKWSHIACTYSAGTLHALYLNGRLEASTGTAPAITSPGATAIGNAPGTAHCFPGQVDDVRFYARPLSAAEIRSVFDEGNTGYQQTLNRVPGIPSQPGPFVPSSGVSGVTTISPDTIVVTTSVGAPTLTPGAVTISPDTVGSGTTIGSPTISLSITLSPDTIGATTAVGSPTLTPGTATISPTTIGAGTTVGSPTLAAGVVVISPDTIIAGSGVGSPTLTLGTATISPTTIASGATVGSPALSLLITVSPGTLSAGTTVGAPAISAGTITVSPDAIGAGSVVGSPTLFSGATLLPDTIAAGTTIGSPTIVLGTIIVSPETIVPTATVGSPSLSLGTSTISPDAISAGTTVGVASLILLLTVSPDTLSSGAIVGSPALILGTATISPATIDPQTIVGEPALTGQLTVSPDSVTSTADVGAPFVVIGTVIVVTYLGLFGQPLFL